MLSLTLLWRQCSKGFCSIFGSILTHQFCKVFARKARSHHPADANLYLSPIFDQVIRGGEETRGQSPKYFEGQMYLDLPPIFDQVSPELG